MNAKLTTKVVIGAALVSLGALAGSLATAQSSKDLGGQPDMPPLPEGWTMADMQACMEAGTPGEMHEWMAKGTGVWQGQSKMWMGPGTEPIVSHCTYTAKVAMDGRYIKSQFDGEIPGMGPFTGQSITGYDNVTNEFVGAWIDSHSTGIMTGTGKLSSDRSKLTWDFTYNHPLTGKPHKMREVDTFKGDNQMLLEMWTTDPKTGKEFKMMEIDFTRDA